MQPIQYKDAHSLGLHLNSHPLKARMAVICRTRLHEDTEMLVEPACNKTGTRIVEETVMREVLRGYVHAPPIDTMINKLDAWSRDIVEEGSSVPPIRNLTSPASSLCHWMALRGTWETFFKESPSDTLVKIWMRKTHSTQSIAMGCFAENSSSLAPLFPLTNRMEEWPNRPLTKLEDDVCRFAVWYRLGFLLHQITSAT